jgi:hypothetical protein
MTSRQSVLLGRLVTFCERCGSPDLPLRIDRVYGYGSFFRGKERPGDVDLIATLGDQHPLFPKFRDLMGQYVIEAQGFRTPAARMDLYADVHEEPEVVRARPLFVSWLKGFSEHKLFAPGLPLWMSPVLYTDHLLRASLPGIKVRLTVPDRQHHIQVVHEVWSPEHRDVRRRVAELWARDQRDDLLKEGVWFERQVRALMLEATVLDRIVEGLVKSRVRAAPTDREGFDRYVEWLCKADLGFSPELVDVVMKEKLDFGRADLPDPPGYRATGFASLATAELRRAVEDMRAELRVLDKRVDALRDITSLLAYWRFRMRERDTISMRDFLKNRVRATRVASGEMDRLGLL